MERRGRDKSLLEVLTTMPKEVRKIYNSFRVNIKRISVGKRYSLSKYSYNTLIFIYSESYSLF